MELRFWLFSMLGLSADEATLAAEGIYWPVRNQLNQAIATLFSVVPAGVFVAVFVWTVLRVYKDKPLPQRLDLLLGVPLLLSLVALICHPLVVWLL